jgi:hypothetical protein
VFTVAQPAEDGNAVNDRDVLDAAVRCLAVSGTALSERLGVAGRIVMTGLSRKDFDEPEDREMFDRINRELSDLSGGDGLESASAESLEGLAGEIVDLRDTLMGRAIHNSTGSPVAAGSRLRPACPSGIARQQHGRSHGLG